MNEYRADLTQSYTLKSVYHQRFLDDLHVLPLNMKVSPMYLDVSIYMGTYLFKKDISFLNKHMYQCYAGMLTYVVSITLLALEVYNEGIISSASDFSLIY